MPLPTVLHANLVPLEQMKSAKLGLVGLIQRVIQLKETALCLILTIHSISDSAAQDGMMQTKIVALNVIVHLGIR
jgi:hypothetical protein